MTMQICKIYTVVKSQKKKKTTANSTLSCWGFTRNLAVASNEAIMQMRIMGIVHDRVANG